MEREAADEIGRKSNKLHVGGRKDTEKPKYRRLEMFVKQQHTYLLVSA